MKQLTSDDIATINKELYTQREDNEQGIYLEPFGVPNDVKEPVVYARAHTGGYSGGDYRGSKAKKFSVSANTNFDALDAACLVIKPNISLFEYRKIRSAVTESAKTCYEYYGNCDDYIVQYIPLSTIYSILNI